MKKFNWVDGLTADDRQWLNEYLHREGLPCNRFEGNSDLKMRLKNLANENLENELCIRKLELAYRTRLSRRKRKGEIACVTISARAEKMLSTMARGRDKKLSEILDEILDSRASIFKDARKECFNEMFNNGRVFEKILSSADSLSGLNKRLLRHYDTGLNKAIKHVLEQAYLPESVKKEAFKLTCESVLRHLNAEANEFTIQIKKHHADLRRECIRQLTKHAEYQESLQQMKYSEDVANGKEYDF